MSTQTKTDVLEGRLSEAAAAAWIPRTCFKNGPPGRLGVEIEQLVGQADETAAGRIGPHLPADRYPALLADLAGLDLAGRVTVEPGGQLELSSDPAAALPIAIATAARDLAAVRAVVAAHGATLVSRSTDDRRPPRQLLRSPRYEAMAAFYRQNAGCAVAGPAMMCSSASLQANVEAACPPAEPGAAGAHPSGPEPVRTAEDRWDLLHTIGPALVAAVANSPALYGTPTGWSSSRQWIWDRIGPPIGPRPADRPVADWWSDQVLDAPVMVVRRPGEDWRAPAGLTFRQWLRDGAAAVPDRDPPTLDDLSYHLTTVFPPVRPRGHLEVRYLDVPPGDWWPVPVAVLAVLLADRVAADRAIDICAEIAHQWARAGRLGLADRRVRAAADGLLAIAASALDRAPAAGPLATLVDDYRTRWTTHGRRPADDDHRDPAAHPAGDGPANGARP